MATHQIDEDIVLAAAISPDGRLAATGGGSHLEVRIWELGTGAAVKRQDGKPLMLAGTGTPGWATGFSTDGQRIAWGNTWRMHTALASNPLEYQMRLISSGGGVGRPQPLDATSAAGFVRARTTFDVYGLSHRKGGNYGQDNAVFEINKDGKVLASIERGSTEGYGHNSYTFAPDGQSIISGGGNGVLIAYDLKGQRLGNFIGHEGDIWAVTPSPDGRYLITGSADHPPLELEDARADPHFVQRQRRRVGDVDAAGLLHGLARRR